MKTSPFGIKKIAVREGTVLHVYNDSKGLPTAGVGHLIKPDEHAEYPLHAKITQAQSDKWLTEDLKECEDAVNSLGVKLSQNEFDALVSLAFNIGVGAASGKHKGGFLGSTVARRLKAGDKIGAAEAILLWDKPPEIQGRRRTEYTQFKTPYKDSAQVPQVTATPTADNSEEQGKPSDTPAPIDNGHTVKAEITAEGAVKVSSTDNTPLPPKERIAVVKAQPQKWMGRVTAKITAAVTGSALFQWIWAQTEKIQSLSVPNTVWVVVSVTIAVGSLLWVVHEIVDTWRENNNQERIDDLLVKENSTPDNLVQLIPSDEMELYRARGFKIITRGEKA